MAKVFCKRDLGLHGALFGRPDPEVFILDKTAILKSIHEESSTATLRDPET